MRLANKVVIITGAGHGLGRVDALMMSKEGAKIVASDVNPALGEETVGLVRESGGQAVFAPCDVRKSVEVSALMNAAVRAFGRLDVIVNNAGLFHIGSVIDTSEEDFDRLVAVNLKGVFLCMKYAIPIMIAQGGGTIVNMSSIAGRRGSPNVTAYNASKGGVTLLTYNVAAAYGDQGIRCNCLCPGPVDMTGMGQQIADSGAARAAARGEVAEPPRSTGTPLGRWGRPEEIANLVIFLASDESPWMNGSAVVIDGGALASL